MIDDWTRQGGDRARARALVLLLAVMSPALASAQQPAVASSAQRTLSLDDAIRIAAPASEALQIARAGVSRASGQYRQARSQYFPQLGGSITYARTLRSQFAALAGGGGGDTTTNSAPKPQSLCSPPIPANATPADRAAALAQATTCPAAQGIDFSKVGFGARNQYSAGLSFSQSVFSGGRISGQTQAASATRRSAEVEVAAQRAQLALDVTQAYFDAVLADRLVQIADTTLAQTEELLRQTTVARRVGNQSEFELLRATVTRDNQRPILIQRQGDRDVAYFRLKQLLNLPLDLPLTLTTPIDQPALITHVVAASTVPRSAVSPVVIDTLAPLPLPDTVTADRSPVRESEQALRASEGQLRVARADRLPTLSITSGYQRLFFPANLFPSLNQYSENWTVGGSLSLSLFNGGRVGGEIEVAQANLEEARARLQQARELTALDTRVALNQLQQAEAAFNASRGTSQQAERAYSIDQIRYREGISTQTDLNQSRLQFEQAVVNQAISARDLAVARARVTLLRDLPLNQAALGGATLRGAAQPNQQLQQQQQQQQQPAQQQTPSTAAGTAGAGQTGGFSQ